MWPWCILAVQTPPALLSMMLLSPLQPRLAALMDLERLRVACQVLQRLMYKLQCDDLDIVCRSEALSVVLGRSQRAKASSRQRRVDSTCSSAAAPQSTTAWCSSHPHPCLNLQVLQRFIDVHMCMRSRANSSPDAGIGLTCCAVPYSTKSALCRSRRCSCCRKGCARRHCCSNGFTWP